MLRVGFGVLGHCITQGISVEYIVPHGGENLLWGINQTNRVFWLFKECSDPIRVVWIGVNNTKLASEFNWLADSRHGGFCPRFNMRLNHLGEVHSVNVVSAN